MPVVTPSTRLSAPQPQGAPQEPSATASGYGTKAAVREADSWPDEERRSPPLSRPDYLHLRELVRSIRKFIRAELTADTPA